MFAQLERLWLADAVEAMASLGYAVHNLPAMVASQRDAFDGDLFGFSFRIAAYHWSQHSPETREALAEAVDLSLRQAEEWTGRDGFVINMNPTGPREPSGWDDVMLLKGGYRPEGSTVVTQPRTRCLASPPSPPVTRLPTRGDSSSLFTTTGLAMHAVRASAFVCEYQVEISGPVT